jgi:hypothetical protein
VFFISISGFGDHIFQLCGSARNAIQIASKMATMYEKLSFLAMGMEV